MPPSPVPPSQSVPAYANAPRRSGLLLALAGIVALAAAAALAIFLFGATAPPMTAGPKPSGDEAKQAMAAAKAALDEASKSVLQPPASPAPPAEPPAPAQAQPSADAPKAEAPVAPPAEAPKAAPAAPSAPPEKLAAAPAPEKARTVAKAEPPKTATRPPPAKAASPAPEPPKALAAAPAAPDPAEAAKSDRWDQMKAEMAQCSSGSLIPRIQCEQRIRVRYCEGYWGSVPACPLGRTDHGN